MGFWKCMHDRIQCRQAKKGQAANFFLQGNPAGLLNVVLGLRGLR